MTGHIEPSRPGPATPTPPGLLRRLAAALYDSFLLVAVIIIAAMPLPLFSETARASGLGRGLIFLGVLVVITLFFGWFWTHGGQTLGMRAWKFRVVRTDGSPPGWKDCVVRVAAAALSWLVLGCGWLWILVDRDRRSWHDRLSGTRVEMDERWVRKRDGA